MHVHGELLVFYYILLHNVLVPPRSSRDSTPVSVISKRKTHMSPKRMKTSTPITTTPKSSKSHHGQPLRPSTPSSELGSSGISESPIPGPSHAITSLNSSSSLNSSKTQSAQSGGEESSSTGTSEKRKSFI